MKNLLVILAACAAMVFISCSKNDVENKTEPPRLSVLWKKKNVSAADANGVMKVEVSITVNIATEGVAHTFKYISADGRPNISGGLQYKEKVQAGTTSWFYFIKGGVDGMTEFQSIPENTVK